MNYYAYVVLKYIGSRLNPMVDKRISPNRAAKLLGVHVNTVYRWCQATEKGEYSRLSDVIRNDVNGYFEISLKEILALRHEISPKVK